MHKDDGHLRRVLHTRPVTLRPAALVIALTLLAATSCTTDAADPTLPDPPSGPPETCDELAAAIVDELQRYVDLYAGMPAEQFTLQDPTADLLELLTRAEDLRSLGGTLGCSPEQLEDLLAAELERLHGEGSVAEAVAATFRARIVGSADPSDPPPVERQVEAGDNLAAVLASVGSGSTLILGPGDHVLTDPLVVLRPVALVGAGPDETRIVSAAGGAVIQYLGDGELRLEGLTLHHQGSLPSSVLVLHDGSAHLHRVAVSGAVHGPDGSGGVGVALGSAGPVEIIDSEVHDNDQGGIVVMGAQSPTIDRTRIRGNGGCGVCFLDEASGILTGSTLSRNDVGILVEGSARPTLIGNEISANRDAGITYRADSGGVAEGNRVVGNGDAGVIVTDRARPELRGNDVRYHSLVGVVVAEQSTPTLAGNLIHANGTGIEAVGSDAPLLEGNEVRSTPEVAIRIGGASRAVVRGNTVVGSTLVGILVLDEAAPLVEGNVLVNDGTVGLVYFGQARGRAIDNRTSGQGIGIQVSDHAAPELTGNSTEDHDQASLVYRDVAAGRAEGNVCLGGDIHIVLFDAAEPELVDNECTVHDEREGDY